MREMAKQGEWHFQNTISLPAINLIPRKVTFGELSAASGHPSIVLSCMRRR